MLRSAALSAAIALGVLAAPAVSAGDVDAQGGRWAGFYAGGHAGGGSGELEGVDSDLSGAVAGGHFGYLGQTGATVIGFEADISWSNYDLSIQQKLGAFQINASAEEKFMTSVRLRAGYAHGNMLLYATGGIAYTEVDTSFSVTGPGINQVSSSTAELPGLIGGVGLEYAIGPNVSLRGEALWWKVAHDFELSDDAYTGNTFRAGISYHFK